MLRQITATEFNLKLPEGDKLSLQYPFYSRCVRICSFETQTLIVPQAQGNLRYPNGRGILFIPFFQLGDIRLKVWLDVVGVCLPRYAPAILIINVDHRKHNTVSLPTILLQLLLNPSTPL